MVTEIKLGKDYVSDEEIAKTIEEPEEPEEIPETAEEPDEEPEEELDGEPEERSLNSEKYWQEVERGFDVIKKEHEVLYGFCLTRGGTPSSIFIAYLSKHIQEIEHILESMFSDLDNYEETSFKINMVKFQEVKGTINDEIDDVKKQLHFMGPFDKLVTKFIRLMESYMTHLNTRMIEILKKQG